MRVLTANGLVAINVLNADDRSAIGVYWNAVRHFLETGDDEPLHPFAEASVNGNYLVTDPDALEAWAASSELEFEDIYSATDR